MKTLKILTAVITLFAYQTGFSQSEEKKTEKKDEKKEVKEQVKEEVKEETKTDNFMDLQTKSMTKLFGSDLSGNPDGKSIGYLELLEQLDLPAEQKTKLRNQYVLQSKTLTQKQKDSLGQEFAKQLKKAQNEQSKN